MPKDGPRDFKKLWEESATERIGDLRVSMSPMEPGEPGMYWDVDELQEDRTWRKIKDRLGQGAVSNFLHGQRAACYQGPGNLTGKYHPNEALRGYYVPSTGRWL